ncbi:unnamed protein product [Rotaria sordida]|uniref:Peptidase M14 domain-containing protein n=1 Tax=Rotaria sordida TaxID=392033 RepID=A0A813N1G4_9BILA|nr:unnamed protein product [Rotaria sordida]CAF3508918.1 unnamed protein product [Rotaria sordida]
MVHNIQLFLFFVVFLNYLQAEEIWFVKFSYKHNYLSRIEKTFPLIDLLQYDYDQSSCIFLVPQNYLLNFARFIQQHNGFYRIMLDNTKDTLKKFQLRSKRWTPSDNPLDKTFYQHFLSYDEQQNWYNLLANSSLTKKFIRLHTIGYTYENRSLTVVQIHSKYRRRYKQQQQRRKLSVFIDGGMHAREWLSIGVANFVLIQFLTLKENNLKVQRILRHFDIFVLSMMNPDGYEYSRTHNRLWRKNRSPTIVSDYWDIDESCCGVDLNRNFPYQWDSIYGSSNHPCSHSYRGSHPSSESEVQSVVNFLQTNTYSRNKFYAYFNLHAYGRFWLLPWTYSTLNKVQNYEDLLKRCNQIASNVMNQTYKVGQASFLLYPCSGTSIDFAATLMPHSMTLELSPTFKGLPMCFETNQTVDHNCTVGFLAGPEVIEIDGTEVFNAIVEYLDSIIQDYFLPRNT